MTLSGRTVAVGHLGLPLEQLPLLDRYAHTIAGLAIAAAGTAVLVLGPCRGRARSSPADHSCYTALS
jgi:hypothetical protein